MLLPDHEIRRLQVTEQIVIRPYNPELVQPASIDVRLHNWYRRPSPQCHALDVRSVQEGHTELHVTESQDGPIELLPGAFILGSTMEYVELSHAIAARFEGKSSLARLGLAVHVTGGFIDPGFSGQVTLEIANLAPWAITLRAGMRIGQLAFHQMSAPVEQGYGGKGHYQGQMGPTESRFRL